MSLCLFVVAKIKKHEDCLGKCPILGLISFILPQREVVPSTRLAAIPPAFSTRNLPAQATEYAFAFIQIPQDVSARKGVAHVQS